jgi:DUF4097 and DUF4098 domain-containing protein YvlB
MNLRLLSTAALAIALTAAAHADDTFHRTLTAGAQPDLYVSTGSGSIRVMASSGDTIEIVGRVHAGWGAFGDVRSRVQHIVDNPPISRSSNEVHIGETNDRSLFNNITIDYEIKAPANAALNLHSGSGDVEVVNLGRFLAATTGSGSVRAHHVHGPANLQAGSGDIELEEDASGDVKARSGSGSIRIHGFNGTFNAQTGSGDIEAEGHIAGASRLSTGSGSVRLHLTPDSRFNLEASTGAGAIRVHMPGISDSDESRHHVTMSVNGGGDPLQIRTGSGDIELMPR